MATSRTIAVGDCTLSVAVASGFTDWEVVWNHADNETLRDVRDSPFCLAEGDQLAIPDLSPKTFTFATGAKYKIVIKRPWAHLRVRLIRRDGDGKDQPVAGAACKMVVGDQTIEVTTDCDGWADAKVPPKTRAATLTVAAAKDHPALGWSLMVGELAPADDPRGAADRLANLGYGAPGEDPVACLPYALRAFQEDAELEVTGELDDATTDALAKQHGI